MMAAGHGATRATVGASEINFGLLWTVLFRCLWEYDSQWHNDSMCATTIVGCSRVAPLSEGHFGRHGPPGFPLGACTYVRKVFLLMLSLCINGLFARESTIKNPN